MASIAKRPNGQWRARYRDDSGREHSRHFARKTDAHRWLDEEVRGHGSEREQRNLIPHERNDSQREAAMRSHRRAREASAATRRPNPPVALYRHFDATGVLLYVGITVDIHGRTRSHAGQAEWAPLAASGTITWFPDEAAARIAEMAAIKTEAPLFNRAGVPRSA